MKTLKVNQLIELLQSCDAGANVFMTSGINEITDVLSVENSDPKIVVVRSDENIYRNTLDQIESLKAALIAKEETHKIKIGKLKEKALNAFLECEGYDEFEHEINS